MQEAIDRLALKAREIMDNFGAEDLNQARRAAKLFQAAYEAQVQFQKAELAEAEAEIAGMEATSRGQRQWVFLTGMADKFRAQAEKILDDAEPLLR